MNILEEIAKYKQEEIAQDKKNFPLQFLFDLIAEGLPPARDFFGCLNDSSNVSIIAELKFASPSRGKIQDKKNFEKIIRTYTDNGARAISVITERKFFKGKPDYIRQVKKISNLPVLRKDFILDEYQIYQSRCLGADAILLITALLDEISLARFQKIAISLGLACLVEVHTSEELTKSLATGANMIGINNRNLTDFYIDLSTTINLSHLLPPECVLVSESGVKIREDVEGLSLCGVDAVLVGESLMNSSRPDEKLRELIGVKKKERVKLKNRE